ERLQKITRADAVRILLIHDGGSDCIAETGSPFSAVNWLSEQSIVSLERLRAGGLIQIPDMGGDAHLKNGGRENVLGSLIEAAVHCLDEFSGVIELRWLRTNAFQEGDGRPAQLMAGLISGLLERKLRARRSEVASVPSAVSAIPQVEPGVAQVSSTTQD